MRGSQNPCARGTKAEGQRGVGESHGVGKECWAESVCQPPACIRFIVLSLHLVAINHAWETHQRDEGFI